MAMGRRKTERQDSLFITADNLPKSQGHPFYQALNRLLAEAGFDRWIEQRCLPYYEQVETRGQRSIPPGVYFRMLLVGYFEGIDSQRGIAWRCADSLSLRTFLGLALDEHSPDHSTLSLTRRRLPPEVFTWLRGIVDVTKRYLIATAAHNLGRVLWKLLGVGKPRSLQGRGVAAEGSAVAWSAFWRALTGRPERNEWLPQRIAVACQILDSAVTLAV